MKRISFIFILLSISAVSFSQISTITVAEKKLENQAVEELVFDSTTNCPRSNFSLLVGQEVYVLPREKEEKSKGYAGFKTAKFNIKSDKDNAKRYGSAAPEDKTRTKSEELENKLFYVTAFEQSEGQYPTYCLTLTEKNNPSNVCKYIFKYESTFNQTFATMKHYAYLKDQCIGRKFYFAKCCLPENDTKTGEILKDRNMHSWTCKDIIISPESGQLTMLLTYEDSETYLKKSSAVDLLAKKGIYVFYLMTLAFSEEEWNKNIGKFGEVQMFQVLNHKISIGMPFDLVRSSIGFETNSNAASYGTQIYYKVNIKEFVRSGIIPYTYFQTGNNEMYVYLDENNLVTGWN